MKTKFSYFSDVIFLTFITFLLSLVIFNFFIPHPYSIIYSALLSALALILFFAKSTAKQKQARIKKQAKKELDELMIELNFSARAEQNAIIEKALKNAGFSVEKKRGVLFLKDKNAIVLCRFSFNKVSKADIVRAYNLINSAQKAYILAQSFEQEITSFAERFDGRVILLGQEKVYKLIKDNDAIPKSYKYKDFAERKVKINLKNLLDRKKAKTFFFFGLLFLLFSYVSPLKLYYIICGCLFLIYSLILKLVGKDMNLNEKQTDNI